MKRGLTIIIAILVIVAAGVTILWYLGGLKNKMGAAKEAELKAKLKEMAEKYEMLDRTSTTTDQIILTTNHLGSLTAKAMANNQAPLQSLSSNVLQTVTLKSSDLNITEIENAATITAYSENVRKALKTFFERSNTNESALLLDFTNNKDESALIKLALSEKIHLDFLKTLVAMEVPESAAPLHLDMVNNLIKMTEFIFHMKNAKQEPILALESSQALFTVKSEFFLQLVLLNKYFTDRGLSNNQTAQ